MRRGQNWWLACAAMVVAVVVSYWLLDRPLSFFAHEHLRAYRVFVYLTYIPEPFAGISTGILIVLGAMLISGRALKRWHMVALTWSVCVLTTWGMKNQLKVVFGRTWPETWTRNNPSLIKDGAYGFNPFSHGSWYESFPSGHTAAVCAAATVLWICYPRFRAVYALMVVGLVVGLIGANFHFLSDIIAGGFLGVSVAIVGVRLAGIAHALAPMPAPAPRAVGTAAAQQPVAARAPELTPPARS